MKQKVLAIILCILMIGSSISLIGFANADPPHFSSHGKRFQVRKCNSQS